MIDPKLNEIPVTGPLKTNDSAVEESTAERSRTSRQGLSINDTIAGDVNLSVGGRGVDTSGVRAGAGAAAGSSNLSSAPSSSPAPQMVPGARDTGTTPGQSPVTRTGTGLPGTGETELSLTSTEEEALDPDHVSARAYQNWVERGSPHGSSEADWHRAEQELRAERIRRARTTSASA